MTSARTARGKSKVTLEASPSPIKKGGKQQTITEMIPMKVSKTRRGQAGLQTDISSAKGQRMPSSMLADQKPSIISCATTAYLTVASQPGAVRGSALNTNST